VQFTKWTNSHSCKLHYHFCQEIRRIKFISVLLTTIFTHVRVDPLYKSTPHFGAKKLIFYPRIFRYTMATQKICPTLFLISVFATCTSRGRLWDHSWHSPKLWVIMRISWLKWAIQFRKLPDIMEFFFTTRPLFTDNKYLSHNSSLQCYKYSGRNLFNNFEIKLICNKEVWNRNNTERTPYSTSKGTSTRTLNK